MRTLILPADASPRAWGRLHGERFRGEILNALVAELDVERAAFRRVAQYAVPVAVGRMAVPGGRDIAIGRAGGHQHAWNAGRCGRPVFLGKRIVFTCVVEFRDRPLLLRRRC